MKNSKYKTPEDFRKALEERIRKTAESENKTVNDIMYKVSFDRFLARIFHNGNENWILKGGYSLELRFKNITGISRTTTDIDFALRELKNTTEEELWDSLKEIANRDLNDWFVFEVNAPTKELILPTYGGWRFLVVSKIGPREFNRFNVDISLAEGFVSNPIWEKGSDILSFAGIEAPKILLISTEKQFAEKIHAYTNPLIVNNSRTRDLVDLVIYIDQSFQDKELLKKEINLTFKTRNTHDVPKVILEPPKDWEKPYQNLAGQWGASKIYLKDAFEYLSDFWSDLYNS
jgi:predicted nucleotidyltransferase component of viral defense system